LDKLSSQLSQCLLALVAPVFTAWHIRRSANMHWFPMGRVQCEDIALVIPDHDYLAFQESGYGLTEQCLLAAAIDLGVVVTFVASSASGSVDHTSEKCRLALVEQLVPLRASTFDCKLIEHDDSCFIQHPK